MQIKTMTTYIYITNGRLIKHSVNPDKNADRTGRLIDGKTENRNSGKWFDNFLWYWAYA